MPMEEKSTLLKKVKTTAMFRPRRQIIQNILNYSKIIEIVPKNRHNRALLVN